jgi:serine/threonine-protein kinase TTK/MPS1
MATSTILPSLQSSYQSQVERSNTSPRPVRNLSLRPNLKRRSPLPMPRSPRVNTATTSNAPNAQLDSSDDEGAAPSLSAAAEELLGGKTLGQQTVATTEHAAGPYVSRVVLARSSTLATSATRASRTDPYKGTVPQQSRASPYSGSPRIVRISRNSPVEGNRVRQVASMSEAINGSPRPRRTQQNVQTPAPRPKVDLVASAKSSSDRAAMQPFVSGGSWDQSSGNTYGYQTAGGHETMEHDQDQLAVNHSAGCRSKTDETGHQNSLRVKRVGKVQGRFLSGPARRGVIRRQSEEDNSPTRAKKLGGEDQVGILWGEGNLHGDMLLSNNAQGLLQKPNHVRFTQTTAHIEPQRHKELKPEVQPSETSIPREQDPQNDFHEKASPDSLRTSSQCRGPAQQPTLPSLYDQENEPPPTFKRNKLASEGAKGRLLSASKDILGHAPITSSTARKALAPMSQNTPRRPAPPPPKMSMLETATAPAGAASTTQRRLKRQYISINGKMFTKMECIGRGGSGRVYRVMAENFKHFALKRVSLDEVDQAAIRGFKGEIDLLKKLENVDRVVRIYDYEINDEKKSLLVLMDLGELDLKKMLDPRLDEETGAFDVTFTRYIWKEMLECVQAIHAYGIVHSDLKPANFVSAQGQLKLIDFGIANAIQDDTINVHREQQIGTPNYMAPEALLDTNALGGRKANLGKLMKLGKPSDVWSLACILYQIVYGKPPFGHIPNQMNKVIAITDPSHAITFPEVGVGNVPVPSGLIRTLRRCLNRDPSLRPTIGELLGGHDPFLHPDSAGSIQITSEHLKAIQHNVLRIIEAHGLPESDDKPKDEAIRQWLDHWAPQLYTSMKASIERATV